MTGVVSVPDLRDYDRINAELLRCLDEGHTRVRLVGAEGQRLLASGLCGTWQAVVEVEGDAGPELARDLDAADVTVVCRGKAGDGAGSSLRAGRLVILGEVDDALAYAQSGGTVAALNGAGHRAGLNQRGGVLVLLGPVGRLAGERQGGGRLFAFEERLGPHSGFGHRGGRLIRMPTQEDPASRLEPEDSESFWQVMRELSPWLTQQ